MANTILIKRGAFSTIPTSFLRGELGWAYDAKKLFVGNGTGTDKSEVLMKNEYNSTSFLYAAQSGDPLNKTPSEVMDILSGSAADNFSFNNKKITLLADPVNPQDGVNLRSMQAAQAGLVVKKEVKVATTISGSLASSFANGSIVDGITLVTGDRILIKNQTNASENGVYDVNATGAPTRSTDFDEDADVAYGAFLFVQEGDSFADTGWVLSTDGNIVIGTTPLVFVQFTGLGEIIAGDGLSKTGNTINVTEDLVWDRDFTSENSILKADTIGITSNLGININSVVGRIATGAIQNIAIDTSVAVGTNELLHTASFIDGGSWDGTPY